MYIEFVNMRFLQRQHLTIVGKPRITTEILIRIQVNGHDLSDATHEETVEAFHSAQEPIIVEVVRRAANSAVSRNKVNLPEMNSVATQTENQPEAGELFSRCFEAPSPPPLYSLDNVEDIPQNLATSDMEAEEVDQSYDMEYEEVVLHKETSNDRIGLTLCYGPTEEDGITDIFIGEVETNSVAGKDGRIFEGDQILRINSQDVHSREEAIKLFSENRSDISLLVCRPSLQLDDGFVEENASDTLPMNSKFSTALSHIEEGFEEEEESTVTDTATLPSQKEKEGKDSGVGHDSAANDESSEQEYESSHYASHKISHKNNEDEQEHEYRDLTPFQSTSFREVLESRYTSAEPEVALTDLTRQIDSLCTTSGRPQAHYPCDPHGSPRLVPRMGTRTIHSSNESHSSSTLNSNSSKAEDHNLDTAYNTAESCNSSPITLELTKQHSSSTLSLTPEKKEVSLASHPKEFSEKSSHSESSPCSSRKNERRQSKHRSKVLVDSNSNLQHQHSDIAYTNRENLAQTIAMQQRMLLEQSKKESQLGRCSEMETQMPNMSDASQMEWVVKRRADGSRYVTRRPIRNKILSERKKKLEDERCGMTTDDDAMSEMKTGRYWSKEDKKRHLQKAKDYKRRKELIKKKMDTLREVDEGQVNLVELSHKKLYRNTMKDMNFTTVEEILIHGGKVHDPRFNLLSVTTV